MLVIAHPGHELRVWRWLELVRPEVCVVTDGAGRCGSSRLASTARVLDAAGAKRSSLFGVLTDLRLYQAVLERNVEPFRRLADRLTRVLVERRATCVVGDAAEGQIMAHDLLREVRRSAVRRAESILGWRIDEWEFALESHPHLAPEDVANETVRVPLTESELAQKVAMARGYPELAQVVQAAFERFGEEAFALESLFPATPRSLLNLQPGDVREYERHGEKQVAAGNYPQVIRHSRHVAPIVAAVIADEAANCSTGITRAAA
ncbi:MAG TPA: hypothetical protein PLV92_18775 [Pirellulaceae bacterium]|nr:hypothetical protein [Pirellulaceae bacterium]